MPTLDEEGSVPAVAELARAVADVVDRVVVLDGGSTDDTVAAGRAAGLEVVEATDRGPRGPVLGKGDSIWRVADLDTDVLVFRDADVRGVGVDAIAALVAAVEQPGIVLAKGSFTRLQYTDGPPRPVSGRITEFVARPLLALLAPELDHVREPLSGQFAIRADVLARLPVVTRYGVDVGLVLDVAERHGPDAVVDVAVGSLTHRQKQDVSLVPMAHDVTATIIGRRGAADAGSHRDDDPDRDVATRLPCGGTGGPLVVRPPRSTWSGRRAS